MYSLSWIIFVGVCIEVGGLISHAVYTRVINRVGANNFWQGNDLSGLYKYDPGYFFIEAFLMGIVAVMRTWIFYLIIKILHDKKVNLSQPFNKEMGRFIFNISYLSLFAGLFPGGPLTMHRGLLNRE